MNLEEFARAGAVVALFAVIAGWIEYTEDIDVSLIDLFWFGAELWAGFMIFLAAGCLWDKRRRR